MPLGTFFCIIIDGMLVDEDIELLIVKKSLVMNLSFCLRFVDISIIYFAYSVCVLGVVSWMDLNM